jgi:hypothetical protein
MIEWSQFYGNIRASDWPECHSFEDLNLLPHDIQLEILNKHLSFLFNNTYTPVLASPKKSVTLTQMARTPEEVNQLCDMPVVDYFLDNFKLPLTSEIDCQGITIKYHPLMECGGIVRAPMFIEVLSLIAPNRIFNHCLEWCSGPGFIGFSLLGKGLCKQLELADIWKPSLDAAQNVETPCHVNTWHIRQLSDIPSSQKYDLIVGNPPWFHGNLLQNNRLTCDPGLVTLKKFLLDAKNYLTPNGMIVLVEGQTYTGPKDIVNVLDETGLQLTQVLAYTDNWHWFAVIEHKNLEENYEQKQT